MKSFFALLFGISLILPSLCRSEEAAFPLYLLGYMNAKCGYLPPPGMYIRNDIYHHSGHVKKGLFGGTSTVKANAKISLDLLSCIYVSQLKLLGADVACGALLPFGRINVHAETSFNVPKFEVTKGPLCADIPTITMIEKTKKAHQVAHGISDALIIPLMLGWHAEEYNLHFLCYQGLFLPTGDYKKGDIANMGQNHFATETDAGFTWLNPKWGTEVSAITGVTVNFTNHKIHYRSGTGWHTEFFAGQYLNDQLQIGMAGYWFYQLTPDKLNGKTFLDGFRGQVLGLAPCISYDFKIAKVAMNLNARYYKEMHSKNYLKGDSFFLTLTVMLP